MIGSPFERTRPEECLSDLALDRLVGDRERSPHLDGCELCAARYLELSQARDRFVMPARPRRRLPPAGLALALAACAAAFILLPRAAEDGFRSKGGPRLSFYVKHGEDVRRGSDRERVSPKDAIRFAYSAEKAYHLAVLSIDPAGAVSVYYPAGDRTRPEAPGSDVALPLSTVLDESVGAEKIFALFCEQPIDLFRAKRTLESSGELPHAEGCHGDRLDWIKEP
jgi:hypothetical protein